MIDIYEERGMSREDATVVINIMSQYKDFFVDVMMAEELQLQTPEENHKMESMKEGVVMFCSFACFGSLPLLGYVIIPVMFPKLGSDILFTASCVVTGFVLFLLGSVKSFFRYVSCLLKARFFLTQNASLLLAVRQIGLFPEWKLFFLVEHVRQLP